MRLSGLIVIRDLQDWAGTKRLGDRSHRLLGFGGAQGFQQISETHKLVCKKVESPESRTSEEQIEDFGSRLYRVVMEVCRA